MEQSTLDPEPSILIESLRDIGYSFNSALADIIDNSITAEATDISVLAIPDDDFRIAVIDNGVGLSRDNLKRAMRLGSSDPRKERAQNDLGRFGLGLKTASFSQCRRLTVVSRNEGKTSAFTWDLDLVAKNNEWTVIEHEDTSSICFIGQLGLNGTLVLWEKVDRLTGSRGSGRVNYERLISEAQDYLALVFHRFLAGEKGLQKISIRVNNLELAPIDPFNTKHQATQAAPKDAITADIEMQAFTLPHRSHYSSSQEYEKYALPGGYLKNQGVYLYRAKRLILYGTWFGIAKKTTLTELTRVRIDIDINQDELWKIDVKKVSAQVPEAVRSRLKSLIKTIGAPSKRTYRRRATRLTDSKTYPTWTAEKSGDKKFYRINRDHPIIDTLYKSLDEDDRRQLSTVFSLIESTFPTESLLYDFANNEKSVELETMSREDLRSSAITFFSALKQRGVEEETIVSIMKNAEPFASRWGESKGALGIEEA